MLLCTLVLACNSIAMGFMVPSSAHRARTVPSGVELYMGLFDGIMKAFGNEEYASPPEGVKASARHILVKTQQEATTVMEKISGGGSFGNLAREYSTCPSKNQGGSLGSFRPGTMVPEFDQVIFNPDTKLNEVVGPVRTSVRFLFAAVRLVVVFTLMVKHTLYL